MRLFSFVAIFLCALLIDAYPEKEPLVQTQFGYVKGKRELLDNGREYTSFQGIPYAKPPIGELRFKAPVPPDSWHFPHDATKESPICIQKNYFFSADPQVEGQEDCLYLNIYVPKTKQTKLLPVMVFIHWGGFLAGRSTPDYLGPQYLMEKDVILVTLNYRLDVFGFLSTLDDAAPGNFAFKDQVLALKFVRDNINSFGGDKNRVTLFGQSAGAGSTSMHLISPESKGLFQQAMSQSGVALNPWLAPLNAIARNVTNGLGALVGCGAYVENSQDLITCLRKVDANALLEANKAFKYFYTEPLTAYGLTIETKTEANPNPFITKSPKEYFQNGEFQKVPYIYGVTANEGILRVAPFVRNPEVLEVLNKNFSSLFPQLMGLALSVEPSKIPQFQKTLINFYLDGKEYIDVNNSKSVQGFIDVYTDRAFTYGLSQLITLHSTNNTNPIWLYNFAYRGKYSYGDLFAITTNNINFNWGASHCDDLIYLFNSPKLFPNFQWSDNDLTLKKEMVHIWTNFAIYGTPDPNKCLNWQPQCNQNVNFENFVFLNVTGDNQNGHKFTVEKGFLIDRLKFWEGQQIFENL